MTRDSFDIVDDRSRVSLRSASRSAYHSRTASSQYHSFLVIICRVGPIGKASYFQWPVPKVEDQVEPLEENETTKINSNDQSILSVRRNALRRSLSCGYGTQAFDDINVGTIHRSRLRVRTLSLGSFTVGDTAETNTEPLKQPSLWREDRTKSQEKPLGEYIEGQEIAESRPDEQNASIFSNEDDLNAADVPLPPSPTTMPLVHRPKSGQQSIKSLAGSAIKRRREDGDDDTAQVSVQLKKVLTCTQKVTVSMQLVDTYSKAPTLLVEPNDLTSTFDISRKNCAKCNQIQIGDANKQFRMVEGGLESFDFGLL